MLQGINARFTDEPLAYSIRVRGKKLSKKHGGRTLGGDDTPRCMYVYRPPWSRGDRGDVFNYYGGNDPHRTLSGAPDYRNGNIKKYVVHHDEKLRNVDECKIAALFIAFREALESATATIEFPGFPPLQLDHQLAVFDTGTGLSTRIWVAAKQIEFQGGPQAHFKMSIGGALIDLPDITRVRDELVRSLRNTNLNPGLSSWEIRNNAHSYRNRPSAMTPVELGQTERTMRGLTIGRVQGQNARKVQDELEGLLEREDQFKIEVAGRAEEFPIWTEVHIVFNVEFIDPTGQREADFDRPFVTYGSYIERGRPSRHPRHGDPLGCGQEEPDDRLHGWHQRSRDRPRPVIPGRGSPSIPGLRSAS